MKQITCAIAAFIMMVVIVVFVCAYVFIHRNKTESFVSTMSSRSLYMTSENFDADVEVMRTMLKDKDESLLMKRCYQFPIDTAIMQNDFDCLWTFSFVLSDRFDKVVEDMRQSLIRIRKQFGKIKGQPYVMVSQAPYMRDEKGNIIVVQYNINSYLQTPINVMKKDEDPDGFSKKLFYIYYIFFPDHRENGEQRSYPFDIISYFKKYESRKGQCFVACTNDSTSSYCGCLSLNNRDRWQWPYYSSCASTPLDGNTKEAQEANFYILYEINKKSNMFIADDLFI